MKSKDKILSFLEWYSESGIVGIGYGSAMFWVDESEYEWFGEEERKLTKEDVYDLWIDSQKPQVPKGFISVREYCKANNVTRQSVHKSKNLDFFILSKGKRFVRPKF